MEKIQKVDTGTPHPWDRIPVILRAVAGFNSCITVSTTSAIFVYSIYLGMTSFRAHYPGVITTSLMLIGPIIMAWSFNNAKSIITTILTQDQDHVVEEKQVVIPPTSPIVTPHDVAIEREIVGPTTVLLRAIAGFISTHVICFCSLLFTWTIHMTYITGHPLPPNSELFMVVVGPIVTSWNFVRASATLSTVIQGASQLDKWRNKIASVISTNK